MAPRESSNIDIKTFESYKINADTILQSTTMQYHNNVIKRISLEKTIWQKLEGLFSQDI